MINRFS